jgi:hypothetical protein
VKEMKFEDIQKSIQEKLGEENVAIISDDIASLISYNKNQEELIKSKDSEIEKLKSNNEKLIISNGNLLKKVPMARDDSFDEDVKIQDNKKEFSYKSMFDEKGNLKKKL